MSAFDPKRTCAHLRPNDFRPADSPGNSGCNGRERKLLLIRGCGMQLVIRTSATARGRMLPQSHWRLKTAAQRPSLPVRQPPYDADFFSWFSNGGIVRGTEAKPLAAYRRRLCCARASRVDWKPKTAVAMRRLSHGKRPPASS